MKKFIQNLKCFFIKAFVSKSLPFAHAEKFIVWVRSNYANYADGTWFEAAQWDKPANKNIKLKLGDLYEIWRAKGNGC